MLHLLFESLDDLCEREEFIYNPSAMFDFLYDDYGKDEGWLDDALVREIIETIDKVEMIPGESTLLCLLRVGLRPEDLCTGTKNLIICKFYSGLNRLSCMGENCYPFLGRISVEKDVFMGCSILFAIEEDFFDICPVHIDNWGETHYSFDTWIASKRWLGVL